MWTIRRKHKHPPHPAMILEANHTARSLLNAAVILGRWQGMLAGYTTLPPDQRAVYAPLLTAELNPTFTSLVHHAAAHAIITGDEALQLRGGGVIKDWRNVVDAASGAA